MGKIISITFLIVMIIAAGYFIFFVGGVSEQSKPIEKYQYVGSVNELISDFANLSKSDENIKCHVTDTVGDIHADYAIRLTVELYRNQNVIEYELKIEPFNWKTEIKKTNIYLTKAYNKTTVSGGYLATSNGVAPLVKVFDSEVLPNFKTIKKVY